jgi:hypothetical protein
MFFMESGLVNKSGLTKDNKETLIIMALSSSVPYEKKNETLCQVAVHSDAGESCRLGYWDRDVEFVTSRGRFIPRTGIFRRSDVAGH